IPALFHLIQKGGNVNIQVMRQSFNLGIGMICVVDSKLADTLLAVQGALHLGDLSESTKADKVIFK
ncbi:MAG: phosphoribosylformylglycinamidine cyclo-ligase, partial [Candidatus Cloacimonetes bacterium]|nr:phosphoribosylformylglycinamidine cyclo-ligase [Candidatus Cloacimonadota bacterium]MCK9185382.1 phosphoribosylformylglycinamidine cyclo-ligase [Candidatus Cloacimonadota bacterium]